MQQSENKNAKLNNADSDDNADDDIAVVPLTEADVYVSDSAVTEVRITEMNWVIVSFRCTNSTML